MSCRLDVPSINSGTQIKLNLRYANPASFWTADICKLSARSWILTELTMLSSEIYILVFLSVWMDFPVFINAVLWLVVLGFCDLC